MSKRQVQKMLRLMAGGEPVELASPMASVKKLARLAFIAQQFGYEYADVRRGGGRNTSLVMLIVPDPSPQARARAGQNWAQYPNAGDGVSVPPLVPDAFELLKARINFDLTGKNAEKGMAYGAVGGTIGCVAVAVRAGGDDTAFVVAGVLWVVLMAALGIGFAVNRKRNAKFAALLQAAGFVPVTGEGGRVRYLPPGAQMPGHGNPFGAPAVPAGPYGAPAAGPYGAPVPGQAPAGLYGTPSHAPGTPPHAPAPGAYGNQPYAPQPYAPQPHAPAGYGQQPPQAPYAPPPAQAPGPYGAQPAAAPAPGPGQYAGPQAPGPGQYAGPQAPGPGQYAGPQAPGPGQYAPQQPPQPYHQAPPHPQQNPHWQPPQP
jgi:hypothetical protein